MFLITTTIIARSAMITQVFFSIVDTSSHSPYQPLKIVFALSTLPFWDMTWVSVSNLQDPGVVHHTDIFFP